MMKSNEYDIRSAVVDRLLQEGVERKNIRIEIPLSTNSGSGRADIVIIGNNSLGCIELKSGKDKFNVTDIAVQRDKYKRAFDFCSVVVDKVHKKHWQEENKHGGTSHFNNWGRVDLDYCHERKEFGDYRHPDAFWRKDLLGTFESDDSISRKLFRPNSSMTCVFDMLDILWRDEIKEIVGKTCGKWDTLRIWGQEKSLNEARPLVINALKTRPQNQWEEKFWKKFDSPIKRNK